MFQELFRIPGLDLPIFGYGLMLVIGFLAGAQLAKYLADRVGLNGELFYNAALLALITGVLGARLSHVLENTGEFFRADRPAWETIRHVFNLRSGGLTFYGGFLLAFPSLVLYAIWKKIPLRLGMDIIAPALMVGLGFGRIGCFLNGCCYGAQCDLPLAVQFPYHSNAYVDHFHEGHLTDVPNELMLTYGDRTRLLTTEEVAETERLSKLLKQSDGAVVRQGLMEADERYSGRPTYTDAMLAHAGRYGDVRSVAAAQRARPVHPSQLYSTLNAFMIAGICYAYFTMPHIAGRVFAVMLILKGISRFLLEMVRTEPAVWGPMSFSMVVSIGLVGLGILLWFVFARFRPRLAPANQPYLRRPSSGFEVAPSEAKATRAAP